MALRWHIQSGVVPIPHSTNSERIAANPDVFSFELSDDEMASLASLDTINGLGLDPLTHEEF